MIVAIIITFTVSTIIAIMWVKGIDDAKKYMDENPDYKGDEFLNWDSDYKTHTEDSF
jgi:hypothetical protein